MVAKIEQGGKSSPAFFTRFTAICSGVALAVFACLSAYDPIPVHADAGNLIGAVDYIEAVEGSEAVALSTGGGAAVAGAVIGVYLCTKNPLVLGGYYDGGNVTVISGLYKFNDEVRLGYEFFTDQHNLSSDAPFTFATAYDFEIGVTGSISSYSASVSYNRYFGMTIGSTSNSNLAISNFRGNGLFTQGSYSARGNAPNYYYRFGGNLSTSGSQYVDLDRFPTTSLSNIFYYEPVDATNVIQVTAQITLPTGELDPANPDVYIENVLRPWVVENYPEYIYLLPEPPQPESQYATDDIIPGIPKDWTIINPELPTSPHLDLTIPDGNFQDIDPGDTFTGFASGVGFWWSMVNEILTTFHIKTLALALLAVAVAIFALYKIGG